MIKRLLLVRHGDAEPFASSDAERALSARGVQDCRRLAAWLAREVPDISMVCHSPYRRARQTANQLCRVLKPDCRLQLSALVPCAEPAAALAVLEQTALDTVLCVSHQPLVGKLRNYLVDGFCGAGYPFATAGVALFECDFPGSGGAVMKWIRYPTDYTLPV